LLLPSITFSNNSHLDMSMAVLLQWRLQGTAASASDFSIFDQNTPDSGPAIELSYLPSDKAQTNFVELVRGKVIYLPSNPESISFWLMGNSSGDTVSVRLIDADGYIHKWSYPRKIDWIGWHKVTIDLSPGNSSHRAWKAGGSAIPSLPITEPAFFRSVEILMHSTPEIPRKVAIGDLSFEHSGQ